MISLDGSGAYSEILARIDALTDERRRVFASSQTLPFALRSQRLKELQEEIDRLWHQRRCELSGGESADAMLAGDEDVTPTAE